MDVIDNPMTIPLAIHVRPTVSDGDIAGNTAECSEIDELVAVVGRLAGILRHENCKAW
jgi:hypothetical protein